MVMTMRMISMELLLIIMSRSQGFNSKRISQCDDDDEEEEEDGVDEDKSNMPKPLQMAANCVRNWFLGTLAKPKSIQNWWKRQRISECEFRTRDSKVWPSSTDHQGVGRTAKKNWKKNQLTESFLKRQRTKIWRCGPSCTDHQGDGKKCSQRLTTVSWW